MEIQVVAISDNTSAGYPTQVGSDLVIPNCPVIPIASVKKYQTVLPLLENVSVQSLAYTTGQSEYGFNIQQVVNDVPQTVRIYIPNAAALTDAQIATEIKRQIAWATAANVIKVVATGSATPLTLTASAGTPIFTITGQTSVITVTNGMATKTVDATGVANVVGQPVKIKFGASHSLKTGDILTFSSTVNGTGSGALVAGKSYRIAYFSADTITVPEVLATGTANVTAGTAQVVASSTRNATADLQKQLTTTKGTGSLNATDNYGTVAITWTQYSQLEESPIAEQVRTLLVMFPSSLIASPYTNSGWQAALDAIL